jgi:hypothetical protein
MKAVSRSARNSHDRATARLTRATAHVASAMPSRRPVPVDIGAFKKTAAKAEMNAFLLKYFREAVAKGLIVDHQALYDSHKSKIDLACWSERTFLEDKCSQYEDVAKADVIIVAFAQTAAMAEVNAYFLDYYREAEAKGLKVNRPALYESHQAIILSAFRQTMFLGRKCREYKDVAKAEAEENARVVGKDPVSNPAVVCLNANRN